jgi:TonB family protein
MIARVVGKGVVGIAFTMAVLSLELLGAPSGAHSQSEPEFSAVDIKGVRHRISDYGDAERAPWTADIVKFVQPDYPSEYRARHTEGKGFFRITLDVNTGSVAKVEVLKSTGAAGLDESAMRAIRLWRWRPGKWKQVDMPLTFTMRRHQTSSDSVRELVTRGKTYYRKGDNDSAIEIENAAIRLQPTLPILYVNRGSAYQQKGERDKALADFNRAIQLDPKFARAYCDRADLEDDLFRQPDKALADYNEAIRLAPDFQRAYFNRGAHQRARHNYEQAITDFTRAIELVPNDFSTYAHRAYAYARRGDRARALTDANVAIKLKPSTEFYSWQATDLRLRAEAYRVIGDMGLALRDLRESVRVAPKDPAARHELAWFLATCPEKRFRNGAEALSTAAKGCELSHWKNSDLIDVLATAYAEAGDFAQAVRYEKQALNDASIAPKEREKRERRLALFQQRKPFRDEF